MKIERISANRLSVGLNKKVKAVLLACIFLMLFLVIDRIAGEILYYFKYYYEPDMHTLAWNDYYKQEEKSLDVIFIGSSHARFAFDTRTYDGNLGVKTFNLSSSGQTPLVGYFALKEALKYQKPRLVVYETYWRVFGTEDDVTPAYFVYDYIKGWDNKLELISAIAGEKNYADFVLQALSRTYKYRDSFIPALKSVLKGQIKRLEQSGPVEYEYFTYYENGFFGSNREATKEKLYVTNPFKKASSDFALNSRQLDYLQKTLDLCKENNIPVLMVTAPLPGPTMDFMKNYRQFHDTFSDISESNGVEYIDYNLENLSSKVFTNDMFYDSNHLNMKGTELLGKMLLPRVEKYLK